MSTHDHRTPALPIAGALAGAALVGHMLPALAGAWPALRRPLGIEDRTASGRGYALTFDDGPHAQGTPAVLEILARADLRATFFLSASRCGATVRSRARSQMRATRSGCIATVTATCCA